MSHLDFSIPAAWVAASYLPLTFLLLFLLIKIGAQRSIIRTHERLNASRDRVVESIKLSSKIREEILTKRLDCETGRVSEIRERSLRQIEIHENELTKCIAASKRKDHEIEQLRENVNRLVGNSGEVTLKTAASFARKQDTPLA